MSRRRHRRQYRIRHKGELAAVRMESIFRGDSIDAQNVRVAWGDRFEAIQNNENQAASDSWGF